MCKQRQCKEQQQLFISSSGVKGERCINRAALDQTYFRNCNCFSHVQTLQFSPQLFLDQKNNLLKNTHLEQLIVHVSLCPRPKRDDWVWSCEITMALQTSACAYLNALSPITSNLWSPLASYSAADGADHSLRLPTDNRHQEIISSPPKSGLTGWSPITVMTGF